MYGGTSRLVERLFAPLGIDVVRVDSTDLGAVSCALASQHTGTTFVLVESPSNPLLRVTDICGIAQLAHAAGARLAVDNTALSPYLQNPLELGADVVVHSATKHLGGHGDATAGVLVTRESELAESIGFVQNAEGNALAPFESWLILRGLKTLAVRVAQETRTAARVAEFLASNPGVRRVHYPGLASHAGHLLHATQARGAGQLISFETGDRKLSQGLCEQTELFRIAVSFGSTHSTISLPCQMSHASVPEEALRDARIAALPPDLVRLSIGLEDSRDLISDLQRVLNSTERRARGSGRERQSVTHSPRGGS
ncbi:UNVERIFIED_CONTAM: hypothetical protein GTU68_042836 [Idotea baltica]|nr:hypothetical protein [Idotea baltica]